MGPMDDEKTRVFVDRKGREAYTRCQALAVQEVCSPAGRLHLSLLRVFPRTGALSGGTEDTNVVKLDRICGRSRQQPMQRLLNLSGRTHQIRAHLASIGLPLFGDTIYGKFVTQVSVSSQSIHCPIQISTILQETRTATGHGSFAAWPPRLR